MKRFLSLVVLVVFVIGIVSGCTKTDSPTKDVTTGKSGDNVKDTGGDSKNKEEEIIEITFMTLTSRQDQTQAAIDEYQEKHPNVKIKVSYNSTDDHKKNLKIAASSDTLPDVWRNWGGSFASYYVLNGYSYDLREYAEKNGWKDKFLQAALDLATFDGKLGGYPFVINGLGIFYRVDMFEKYGIKVPETFEEFEKAMEILKANGITPISTAGKYGWHVMRLLEEFMEMYCGSEMHDKLLNLEADWTHEGVVKSFAKLKEWADKGYFPEGFLTADPNDTKLLLYSDMAAMDIQGPWYETNLIVDEQDKSKYGFFKLPLTEEANRMSAFIEMFQFNSKLSEDKLEACMDFVEFMTSEETVAKHNLQQPLPYRNLKLDESLVMTRQVLDAMDKYGTFTITDQSLPQEVVSKLFEAQDKVILGEMTPEEAAEFMQNEIEKYKASQQ